MIFHIFLIGLAVGGVIFGIIAIVEWITRAEGRHFEKSMREKFKRA